ncbi:hypothetical protein [Streptomyces sp. RB17]|uniref:hypothetical protein n=1 Tax=Streptomyces sp. RB17 TaxID=2585197 RepID=UPI001E383547|nr:hypothetical protein [Streptomyces sp. RB17]
MSHRVAVLALDGVLPLDLGIPARVFNEAREPDGTPLYSVVTCALGGQPVRTHEDYRLVVDHDESVLESADSIVLDTQEPGEHPLATGALPEEFTAALDPVFMPWPRRDHPNQEPRANTRPTPKRRSRFADRF